MIAAKISSSRLALLFMIIYERIKDDIQYTFNIGRFMAAMAAVLMIEHIWSAVATALFVK